VGAGSKSSVEMEESPIQIYIGAQAHSTLSSMPASILFLSVSATARDGHGDGGSKYDRSIRA